MNLSKIFSFISVVAFVVCGPAAIAETCEVSGRSTIFARSDDLFFRAPSNGRIFVRFTRPDSTAGLENCTVSLKSKILYRNGRFSRVRALGLTKSVSSTKVEWNGPLTRRVRDAIPSGRRIRSIFYIAADMTCNGTLAHQTNFVGRYVPSCGSVPTLSSADAFRTWLDARIR